MNSRVIINQQVNSNPPQNFIHSEKQLLSVLYDSPVAIYLCDSQGHITFFNTEATKLWGRTPKLGHDLWSGSWKIYYPDGTPMPLDTCPMAMTLKNGQSYDGEEILIERPDHSIRNVLVYPKPLFDSNNVLIGAHNTLVDITDQKKEDITRGMLANIITSSDDAIISKNLKGIITSWNKSATKIFGYEPDEIIGKSIKLLIPSKRKNEEKYILESIARGEQVQHYETERLKKNGEIVNLSLTISPIKNQKGEIIGASKIARDITEMTATRNQKDTYTKQLELLNQHKDEFMSLASHELKTPLTSAKAYIQLLSKLIEEDHKGFGLIERAVVSISRLESLINDLLDLSKIKAGKLQYHMESINFNEVLENSVESAMHLSSTHKIIVENLTNLTLTGDKVRLEQVLNNLLENAIKYSPEANTVEVSVSQVNDKVVVSIKDEGIGIPKESIKHLMERYYRVDNNSVRFPGLGMGLYISTEILKRHGGKLWVKSKENQGSIFYFDLPINTES